MDWKTICEHPALQDTPFEVETNGQGQIVLSPHPPDHSLSQGAIMRELLVRLPGGKVVPELALVTDDGVKVIDVAWVEDEHARRERGAAAYAAAPALCIEIMSHSNTEEEMAHKRALYFARRAREVWVCQEGRMRFFGPGGELKESQLCPDFPASVSID